MTRFPSLLGAVLLLLLTSCGGSARLVRRDLTGGIIALTGQRAQALELARVEMRSHCGGRYEIVSEQETVVGEQRTLNTTGPTLQAQSRDLTEDRIEFRCESKRDSNDREGGSREAASTARPTLPPGLGGIAVDATASEAEIFIDGEPTGQVTPAVLSNLRPGPHTVEVRSATHTGTAKVEVVGGAFSELRVGAKTPRIVKAILRTEPAGAAVLLDGKPVGLTPATVELPAGEYRVRASHPDAPDYEGFIALDAVSPQITLPLPPAARHQVRFFPAPLELEYAHRVDGNSWIGLNASVAAVFPRLQSIAAAPGATFIYRWQSNPSRPWGFGLTGGGGVSALSPGGGLRNYVGIHATAGAEVRWHFLALGLDALYLTPLTFARNDSPELLAAPLLLKPRLMMVFSF